MAFDEINVSVRLALFISEGVRLGNYYYFYKPRPGGVAFNMMNLNVCLVLFVSEAIQLGIIITFIDHTRKTLSLTG